MKLIKYLVIFCSVAVMVSCLSTGRPGPMLSVHPRNPHYLLFRGKPVILIGSTEHYGAVMNLGFDYIRYLNELASCGLNVTRTFSGAYVEPAGAFGIRRNTLAPDSLRYICPWSRSLEPGYANGGNRFDLSEWDPAYFERLKDFIREAGRRNIVVELDLFSNYYDTVQWKLSPLYIGNNINRIGDFLDQREALSLKHQDLLSVQENMVRKIVHELKDFDNLYYEICNEPYFGDTIALRKWEDHMTGVVVEAEKDFQYRHLISNNIANKSKLIEIPRKGVSIYNFHYASPPVTVEMNFHLNYVIGDNETGFDGIDNTPYRLEAWNFILAGGGLFDNLDYSFTVGKEDGSYQVRPGQPGGGGRELRKQFRILADFINSADFIKMKPVNKDIVRTGLPGTYVEGLSNIDRVIMLYISTGDDTHKIFHPEINIPAGSYQVIWLDPVSGNTTKEECNGHRGGWLKINSPGFIRDIALRIEKKQ